MRGHAAQGPESVARPGTDLPVPDRIQIYADMAALFLQNSPMWKPGFTRCLSIMMGTQRRYFTGSNFSEDLPVIHERRERRANNGSLK